MELVWNNTLTTRQHHAASAPTGGGRRCRGQGLRTKAEASNKLETTLKRP